MSKYYYDPHPSPKKIKKINKQFDLRRPGINRSLSLHPHFISKLLPTCPCSARARTQAHTFPTHHFIQLWYDSQVTGADNMKKNTT